MGIIIPIDFNTRSRIAARPGNQAAGPVPAAGAGAVPDCAACAVCLYAPLLLFWGFWLAAAQARAAG